MNELTLLHQAMRDCRRCLEAGYEITPGAVFSGQIGAQVMIVGQAPGVTEVAAKRPFSAGSGRRLFIWLGAAGWEEADFRARHYMTAVTKCYPGKNGSGRGDRVPGKSEQALCRPFLEQEIALVNPRLIIPVGGLAIRLFFPAGAKLEQVIGTAAILSSTAMADPMDFDLNRAQVVDQFESHQTNAGRWVVPLPHPSGASLWPNRPENQALIDRAIELLAAIRRYWGL